MTPAGHAAPSAQMATRHARCSCGQLSADVSGEPVRISVCHCLNCQVRSGGPFAQQARFKRGDVTVSGQSTEYVITGDEGSRAHFHFCPRCGATVYYLTEGMEDFITLPVGVFADPQFPAPQVSVYESRKHQWVQVPVDAEHYP